MMKPNHFVVNETIWHPLYPQEEFIKQKAMLRILEGSCGVEKNTEERLDVCDLSERRFQRRGVGALCLSVFAWTCFFHYWLMFAVAIWLVSSSWGYWRTDAAIFFHSQHLMLLSSWCEIPAWEAEHIIYNWQY